MTERGKQWRVKYDGVCDRCGTPLLRGQPAVWDRSSKTIRCIECPTATEESAPPAEIERGNAGASATREYERRMAKRDSVARDKWGNRLGGVVLALTEAPVTTRAWKIGGAGEAKLAAALVGRRWTQSSCTIDSVPGTRGNIDHIVIGRRRASSWWMRRRIRAWSGSAIAAGFLRNGPAALRGFARLHRPGRGNGLADRGSTVGARAAPTWSSAAIDRTSSLLRRGGVAAI